MERGTKVRVLSDTTIHPKVRGREGVVHGVGQHGVIGLELEGESYVWWIDPSVLEIIDPPPQENVVQEPILPFIPN